MRKFSAVVASAALVVAGALGTSPAFAQQKLDKIVVEASTYKDASQIPVEVFFKRAEYAQMVLSPKGDRLAAVVPFKGRDNLVVIDLAKRTRQVITSFETLDVGSFSWVSNDRLLLTLGDGRDVLGRLTYKGQYAVDWDGSNIRDLSKVNGRVTRINLLRGNSDSNPEVVVSMAERSRRALDVYRFDTKTGRYKLLSFDSPGETTGWVVDWDGVPKAAIRNEDNIGKNTVWVRASENDKWEKISEIFQGDESIRPLAFDGDNKTLYVSSNVGRDKAAIYKYDIVTKKLGDLVFEHPLIDVDGDGGFSRLIFSRSEKKLLGISYSAEMPAVKWFDPALETLQKQLDATLKGKINSIGLADNRSKMLVYSSSATDSGEYLLYNSENPGLEPIAKTRPWLNPELMPERKFIKYKARDGLEIPAWVTIPKGSTGKNLPLVVNIHGGPWVRSYSGVQWGRPEAQFLASRGYVVLEPEPRASDGFGLKLLNAGRKQYGLAMQDDITDGVLHLVKEGIVDKDKVCLFGASYGGYATLMGLAKEPDMFRCGIALVALVDLETYMTITYADYSEGVKGVDDPFFLRWVGDLRTEKQKLRDTSPNYLAAKIKAPIMLTMGSDDQRVPLVQGEKMRNALRENNKRVDWNVYTGEGHGINKDENRFDYYSRVEKFLAEHMKK